MPSSKEWASFQNLEDALNFTGQFLQENRNHSLEDWAFERLGELDLQTGVGCLKQICPIGIQNPSALLRWAINERLKDPKLRNSSSGGSAPTSLQPSSGSMTQERGRSGSEKSMSVSPPKRTKVALDAPFDLVPALVGFHAKMASAAAFCSGCGEPRRCETDVAMDERKVTRSMLRHMVCSCGTTSIFQITENDIGQKCKSLAITKMLPVSLPSGLDAPLPSANMVLSAAPGPVSPESENVAETTSKVKAQILTGLPPHWGVFCVNCGESMGQPVTETKVGNLNCIFLMFYCKPCQSRWQGTVTRSADHLRFHFGIM